MRLLLSLLILTMSVPAFAAEPAETGFERVVKTGTLRCGYNVYAPYFLKDANSGAFSGIFYDIMEELAKNAGLKIVWAEEVGYEGIFSGLDAGRYDALCSGLWPNTARAKAGSFTVPVFYNTVTAWGRADETRFSSRDALNKDNVRIATIDGAQEDTIARTDFPLARRVSSPTSAPFTDNFVKISTGKADVTFVEPSLVNEYVAANPGSLKQLMAEPLRIFGNTVVVRKGDMKLKEFLDQGLQELLYSGRIDAILKHHEKYPGSFMRISKPYESK